MDKKNNYTAADIERYHSGNMADKEMYALEKAALEDPFLAEAIEGYSKTKTAQQDLLEIRRRMNDFTGKKRVFLMGRKGAGWKQMAAAFIILCGAGVLFYLLNPPATIQEDSLPAIASISPAKEHRISASDNTMVSQSKKDSTEPRSLKNGVVAPRINPQQTTVEPAVATSASAVTDSLVIVYNKSVRESQSAKVKEHISSIWKDSTATVFSGTVVANNGQPVPYANIILPGNAGTITDANGKFELVMNNSNAPATVAAAGYKPVNTNLNQNNNQPIVLEPQENPLSEVTASTYNLKKNQRSVSAALAGKAPGINLPDSLVIPVKGWEAFHHYIKNNIRPVYNEAGNKVTGEVRLSFDVKRSGKADNIQVIQSLSLSADAQAKRLLRNSPIWKRVKNKRGEVAIQFR